LFKGYGAKVGLGNMRVKAENRMVTKRRNFVQFLFLIKNYSWMHFVFRLYRVKCILSTSWKKIRNVIVSFYK
jgi:hypothetical protein